MNRLTSTVGADLLGWLKKELRHGGVARGVGGEQGIPGTKWATFVPLSVALLLRLYPYLYSGEPFTTVSWLNIYMTDLLLKGKVPLSTLLLYHETLGSEFFSALFSRVTALPPTAFEPVLIPAISSLSVIAVYLMARDLGWEPAFLSSTFLALFYGEALIDGAVKNAVYGEPLFLIALWLAVKRGFSNRDAVLLSLISLSLVPIYVYFTGFIALLVLFIALHDRDWRKLTAAVLPVFAVAPLAQGYLSALITPLGVLLLSSYFAYYFLVSYLLRFRVGGFVTSGITLAVTLAFLFVRPPYYVTFPYYLLPLTVPYIVGFHFLHERKDVHAVLLLSSVLFLLLVSVVVSLPIGFYIAFRLLDYLVIPLALLFGQGASGSRWGELALVLLLLPNLYAVFITVNLQLLYTGGQVEVYTQPEYFAAYFVTHYDAMAEVSADVKYQFLFQYFGGPVDRYSAYYYLLGKSPPPALFLLDNTKYYQLGYNEAVPEILPPDSWRMLDNVSVLFTDGAVSLYSGV